MKRLIYTLERMGVCGIKEAKWIKLRLAAATLHYRSSDEYELNKRKNND